MLKEPNHLFYFKRKHLLDDQEGLHDMMHTHLRLGAPTHKRRRRRRRRRRKKEEEEDEERRKKKEERRKKKEMCPCCLLQYS